jgi:transcriptional regulator with XRE-family HTH domain
MTQAPPTRQIVAAEVRAAMGRAHVTATTLAPAIGISRAGLSERLNGHRPFDTDQLAAIAKVLGVDVFSLMLPPPTRTTATEAATA